MGNVNERKGNKTDTYKAADAPPPKVTFTEEELRAKLTEEEYNITQGKGKHC